MKKNLLVLGAALTLLLTLSACGRQTVIRTTDTLDQAEPEASAAEPLPAEPAAGEEETAWSLDPTAVTDDFAADTLIRLPELALSGLGFTFDTPRELTSQQLYLLFLFYSFVFRRLSRFHVPLTPGPRCRLSDRDCSRTAPPPAPRRFP